MLYVLSSLMNVFLESTKAKKQCLRINLKILTTSILSSNLSRKLCFDEVVTLKVGISMF